MLAQFCKTIILFPRIMIFFHLHVIFTLDIVRHVFIFLYLLIYLYAVWLLIKVIVYRDQLFRLIFEGNLYHFHVVLTLFHDIILKLDILVVFFCPYPELLFYGIQTLILFNFFQFQFFIILLMLSNFYPVFDLFQPIWTAYLLEFSILGFIKIKYFFF